MRKCNQRQLLMAKDQNYSFVFVRRNQNSCLMHVKKVHHSHRIHTFGPCDRENKNNCSFSMLNSNGMFHWISMDSIGKDRVNILDLEWPKNQEKISLFTIEKLKWFIHNNSIQYYYGINMTKTLLSSKMSNASKPWIIQKRTFFWAIFLSDKE